LGSTGRSFSLAAATVPARPVDVRWESADATLCDAVCALEDRRDPSDPPPLVVDAGPPRAVAVPPELLVWPAVPPVIVDVFVLFEAARWVEPLRGSSGDGEHKVRVRFTRHGTRGEKASRDAFPLRHETRLREVSGGCEVAGGEGDVTATIVTCDSPSGRAVDGHVSDLER
jgi:hypothetical protein